MYRKSSLLLSILLAFTVSCNIDGEMKKISHAQKDADFIIAHLDKREVLSHFPKKNFSEENMKRRIDSISNTWDWPKREGRFVDYVTFYSERSKSNAAFVYEYFLKHDSIRLILIYDMALKEPEFYSIQVQPLETKGPLIPHPERQLLHNK